MTLSVQHSFRHFRWKPAKRTHQIVHGHLTRLIDSLHKLENVMGESIDDGNAYIVI
jgi:hypothetical protein